MTRWWVAVLILACVVAAALVVVARRSAGPRQGPSSGWPAAGRHLAWQPQPHIIHDFLTGEECDELVSLALAKGMTRNTVSAQDSPQKPSGGRTSHGVFLDAGESPVVDRVLDKASGLLGKPRSHMESLQVLRYEPGQEYADHFDSCMDGCDGGSDIDRYATIVAYLNDVARGGETAFPRQGVQVTPAKGRAVVFFDLTRDGKQVLDASLHRAVPPRSGPKWSAAVWVRATPLAPGSSTIKMS